MQLDLLDLSLCCLYKVFAICRRQGNSSLFSLSPSWYRFRPPLSTSRITIDPNIFCPLVKTSNTTFSKSPSCGNYSPFFYCSYSLCYNCSPLSKSLGNFCRCSCSSCCSCSFCCNRSFLFCHSHNSSLFCHNCNLPGFIL